MKYSFVYVKHIRDSILSIEEFVKGVSKSDFLHCEKTQDAVVRRLEVMGEATKNIPVSFQKKYSDVSWKAMARMRDKLIHHYFRVDLKVVWEVIKKDLPKLKKQILKILDESEEK
ncbi:Protein of unknown function DUF86, BT0167 group [hydrothermal vent metagenome]|uniref:DUF86 domain-containing protein n=1 Tax=hydrothermal vent metagenome TaxID=652676 RepID=A0A3B0TU28_9ZZZZ